MRESVNFVTQSKFFSPAFNAAIFDGPIRIYFAQYQESQALKIYFDLQERFQDVRRNARGIFKDRARNIFIMLYPTQETFDLSFISGAGAWAAGAPSIARSSLGQDFVVGVRGPIEDEDLADLYAEMDSIVKVADISRP